MRLISFTDPQGTRIGALKGSEIVDFQRAAPNLPGSMSHLLEAGAEAMDTAAKAAQGPTHLALAQVKLESPVLRPGKILAIGLNYRAHAEESGLDLPQYPLVFSKQSTSINGPYDPVHWSADGDSLDYEGELAVVIGKRCRRVPREHAADVIAGYAVSNDVSVRHWQMRGQPSQFTMGKSWDTHCPLGPALVTPEELNPHSLRLQTWVNGELRQDSHTDDLIFDCFDIIAYLSTAFTLEPGDVILTGTPSGVGMAMAPPRKLGVGDHVKIAIEGLGYIQNEVIAEPTDVRCF